MANGLATLSSGLLARKGQARPAMRSQGVGGYAASPQPLEDLGWDDMGPGRTPSDEEIVAQHIAGATVEPDVAEVPLPAVLVERAALAAEIAPAATGAAVEPTAVAEPKPAPTAVATVSVATATRLRRETAHAGKAAFTLRLDADRHLRMRLASAITNRSAQALVAQALDQLLLTLPEVEILVAQLPPATRRPK